MARVVLEHVTKIFPGPEGAPIHAVEDLSFSVEPGEFVVLLGPSGSGKTTTLRLIAGLERPSQGAIFLDGRSVGEVAPKDREVGMVFQSFALYPHLTVSENLALGLRLRKVPKPDLEQRVGEVAEQFSLRPLLGRLPATLSGGEQQRVAIARALVRRPKVLLLDEPLSNFDAQLRGRMRLELAALHRQLGLTMVYVTHDQTDAMALGHRLGVLRSGVLQQMAEPMGLYRRPANRFVAGFLGSPPINFLAGRLELDAARSRFIWDEADRRVLAIPSPGLSGPLTTALRSRPDAQVIVGVRPHEFIVRAATASAPERGAEWLTARVESVEPLGADTFIRVVVDRAVLVARVGMPETFAPGQEVELRIDWASARFFDPGSGLLLG